ALWKVLAVAMLAAGCSNRLNPDSGGRDTEQDSSDVDTTDPDDDTRDIDTEGDTDIVDCRFDYQTPAPGIGSEECLTDILECGQLEVATTVGGSTVFGRPEYE